MPANQKTRKTLILSVLEEVAMKKLQGIVDFDSDKAFYVGGKGPRTSGSRDNEYNIKELKATINCGGSGYWKRECTKPPKNFREVMKRGLDRSVARIAETVDNVVVSNSTEEVLVRNIS